MDALTVLICIIIAAGVFFAVKKMIKDRKNGRSRCGGDCSSCGMCGNCDKYRKEH